jgi:glycosyltransferase involved in cell wall biosynthesis
MHVLMALTYYRPHYSGLTIYVERLARALAGMDHQVTILTSRFDPRLPAYEKLDGVDIFRPWVLMRISKGVIMPGLPALAINEIRRADIINVHLPQLDAAYISSAARLMGKPVVMTYHCDLHLPPGIVHRAANLASTIANQVTALAANLIVTNTRDYAENSALLRRHLEKVEVIPPSVQLDEITPQQLEAFQHKHQIEPGQQVIGMLARLASEKGVEYLVEAIPEVLIRYPQARVLYVGQFENVLGEEAYFNRLLPKIKQLGHHWKFLGVLPDAEVTAFFQSCHVTVLPSLNSTESFGMVQIESMVSGTPVVATDLPGVRQPVNMTGMGIVVAPGDPHALSTAILEILDHPDRFRKNGDQVKRKFSPSVIAAEYVKVFEKVMDHG